MMKLVIILVILLVISFQSY
ncbi:type I toxin-antitoxin system Ibs family toxin [Salmonella enterica]|uniref:Type I toxin-antitoxin system Ibs family toxin n=1 Tax=Salmonella enterica subsp. houtenae serovar 45:g,z51:- TaxID=1967611 RepID=A0A753EH10_SALHO|nr:type I toxin-antitoxin system Ibs family toxin [Salmonella enterica]EAB6690478.1 type I toxin-antitoxin system Ibs family toxin [Salmonella enterica subsp. enterica serovar Kapemba]EAW2201148.1 type I toxin-antitoxin system Ibs family toxin [Salmonella enterica subsp. enterica]HAF0295108.1 type I toxin-antitoxin system Ibs family toxin [Salmonella enterica subsp. houtenae serovar 43:z4,z32:-]HBJ6431548.1 type I toxin-antitoxin system Ibs family toxin [Salmonella enterica subsp. enterica sero